MYRKDRPSRGGGVLIAVKESLFSSIIQSPPDLEIVTVKIGQGNNNFICCVYIPPECSFSYVSHVVQFLTDLTPSFCKCVILGDFNFPDIDWSILMGTSNSSNCFCNFVFDCNLTQHVSEPTHVKGNLLDLVLSSASVVVNRLTVYPLSLVDFSDHHAISLDFCCSVSSVPKCNVYDFCNIDYESISSFLLDSDFSAVFDSSNIEFIWFFIKSLICKAMSLYIPRILVKRHQGPKWFNSNIRHHLKCLSTLKRHFKVQPTLQREHKIHRMENLLQSKLVQAKSEFESKLIEFHHKSNYSAIYSYIRSFSNQNVLPSTLHLDDIFAVSDSEKASLFNKYFHSVFTRSSFQLPPFNEMDMPSTTLSDICISELDVFRVLSSLDVTKAKGCDGISPKLLKNLCFISLSTSSPSLFPEFITEISSSRVAHSFNQTYIQIW